MAEETRVKQSISNALANIEDLDLSLQKYKDAEINLKKTIRAANDIPEEEREMRQHD